MTLAQSRIVTAGETPHAHEREALHHLVNVLPNTDPFHVWSLVDLLEPSSGRLYEIDAIVLGYSAIYLVEIKSGPGVYTGDQHDWYRADPPGARPHYLENPYRLTNHKAKVLASRLRLACGRGVPRVEPLVFLSHPEARIELAPEGRMGVVDRAALLRAVANHDFPGADPGWAHRKIERPVASAVLAAMRSIGIRPRKGQQHVGAYELGTILGEGPGHQDRLATHRDLRYQRRARVYLVPDQTSVERRQQLRRAAEREVAILRDVREHPSILRFLDYIPDAPLGPTVLFDELDDAVPLDAFLRRNPALTFAQRIHVLEQVGLALAYCHKRGVVHGSVGPHAVLVRQRPSSPDAIDVRLFGFELGSASGVEGTSHLTAIASESASLYLAPELATDPESRSPAADLYGLGALAYLVLTSVPPAESSTLVHVRLAADRCLDPRAVANDLPSEIVALVRVATQWNPTARSELVQRGGDDVAVIDDVESWTAELVRVASAAKEEARQIDPLEAQRDAALVATSPSGEAFDVQTVLGHGATARVLGVRRKRDGRDFALKVPLTVEAGVRFADEAATLRQLHREEAAHRIVQLEAEVVIAGRPCLLLSVAGQETLHRRLAREGALSLEDATRFGEDLLLALEVLEDKEIGHRDLKPANLGVGARGKGAKHLTLFDFSLSRFESSATRIGTAAYRDPILELRGAWDAAADRWSAAVVLHEMLTGSRPTFTGVAVDPEAQLLIASDRFDAALRAPLTAFFERALAREVGARFATARDMRVAWLRAVDGEARSATGPATEALDDEADRATEEALRIIRLDSPIFALPLSPRAKNALDRAGLVRAEQLLQLADNRLSAIRGIGRGVAREILDVRDRWEALLAQPAPGEPAYFPGYQGDDLPVVRAFVEGLGEKLRDAGFTTLGSVAASPVSLVHSFAKRAQTPEGAIRSVLRAHHERAAAKDDPRTLEAWMLALFPATKKKSDARGLYGLAPPFEGRLDVRATELAAAVGITTAAVYIEVGKERKRWTAHPHLARLQTLCSDVIERAWGALPLGRAADQLLTALPYDTSAPRMLTQARAAALFRVVAEVEKAQAEANPSQEPELRIIRIRDVVWVVTSHELVHAISALGAAADELAARPVPAALAEAKAALAPIVLPTTLAGLPDERLLELAALASTSAACSARLEIVPRSLAAPRALALCAPLLRTGLAPDDLRSLVAARYPAADALPDRPGLDALLEPFGLLYDEEHRRYRRKGESSTGTSLGTHLASATSTPLPPKGPRTRRAREAAPDLAFVETDDALRRAVELRTLRVVSALTPDAADAARAVARLTGARVCALDRLILDAMKAIMAERKVDPRVVHQADLLHDSKSPSWARLLQLARAAAERVKATLLPTTEPLLLVQPGLIARYELGDLLTAILDAGRSTEHPAVFLLVPGFDAAGVPPIEGTFPLPGVLASHVVRLSRAWAQSKLSTEAA